MRVRCSWRRAGILSERGFFPEVSGEECGRAGKSLGCEFCEFICMFIWGEVSVARGPVDLEVNDISFLGFAFAFGGLIGPGTL